MSQAVSLLLILCFADMSTANLETANSLNERPRLGNHIIGMSEEQFMEPKKYARLDKKIIDDRRTEYQYNVVYGEFGPHHWMKIRLVFVDTILSEIYGQFTDERIDGLSSRISVPQVNNFYLARYSEAHGQSICTSMSCRWDVYSGNELYSVVLYSNYVHIYISDD